LYGWHRQHRFRVRRGMDGAGNSCATLSPFSSTPPALRPRPKA
jgi:hypothetical protein